MDLPGDVLASPSSGYQANEAAMAKLKTILAGLGGGGGAQSEDQSGLQGALWRALGVPTPQFIQNINTAAKNYGNAPVGPAAAPAAPTAPPAMGPAPAIAGLPQVGTRSPLAGGGGLSLDLGTMPQMPPTPQIQAPKLQGIPGYDFTEYKKLLDKANVTSTENMANVFGGLAKGAGSVSATEPGSFAHALAAAGAGGMEGYRQTQQQSREDAQRRAGNELQMLALQHSASKDSAELAYKGAELQYKADIANKTLAYEQAMKKFELGVPKVQHDANGVTIQQVDPNTGKITAQYHPTKTFLDHAEKMKDIITAVSGNGAVAEGMEMKMLMDTYRGQPQLAQAALTQLAVRRTIDHNAGQAVFGPAYELAAKNASKQLMTEQPSLQSNPALFQKTLNERVTAALLNDPKINQYGWLKDASSHSMAAKLLWESMSGGQSQ
jgi:hypothetical protein